MEVARAGRSAGMARDVLQRARRRSAGAFPAPDRDRERLNAAFASILNLMREVSKECEKCYGSMAANKCKENEIKHFCKYHGKSVERRVDPTEEERTEGSVEPSQAQTCQQRPRRPSKDFYIEVSPGIYSVTAISEDMVEQTHVVDVNAGQSVDLTFVL
ncbi:A-kinase-interacting protein 1 isoform X2 [Pyrgilauda ruficollis]|uniref:A-kinase-interacting protein 1 isoform X2 n=1 Tax=Pyrgilauda ruficollis TaxID=221976 RepID=UPI001B86B11B|nr:A-kinase-interacting protein 1 isoform X2 [Pyrgilauda ruficollis]